MAGRAARKRSILLRTALVVTGGVAGVREGFVPRRNELPIVASGVERQLQHAERVRVAHLAVGRDGPKFSMALATGAHHELPDAALGVCLPIRVLAREAFVEVIV